MLKFFKFKFKKSKPFFAFIVVGAFMLLSAIAVYGVGVWDAGHRVDSGALGQQIIINIDDDCQEIDNTSSVDYFVPTKTTAEWDSFEAAAPGLGVAINECCDSDCVGKDCGDDGCGGSCGSCPDPGAWGGWSANYCWPEGNSVGGDVYRRQFRTVYNCEEYLCVDSTEYNYNIVDNCVSGEYCDDDIDECALCPCDWVGEGSVCGFDWDCGAAYIGDLKRRHKCDGCFGTGYESYLDEDCTVPGECADTGCSAGYYLHSDPFGNLCWICPEDKCATEGACKFQQSGAGFGPYNEYHCELVSGPGTGECSDYLDWVYQGQCGPEDDPSGCCCTDNCSPAGKKRCLSNTLYTCGDYDADSCLEWGGPSVCPCGCVNGANQCTPCCTDDCSPAGKKVCLSNKLYTCDNYDADSCLEWGGPSVCPCGCVNGSNNCIDKISVCANWVCTNQVCTNSVCTNWACNGWTFIAGVGFVCTGGWECTNWACTNWECTNWECTDWNLVCP